MRGSPFAAPHKPTHAHIVYDYVFELAPALSLTPYVCARLREARYALTSELTLLCSLVCRCTTTKEISPHDPPRRSIYTAAAPTPHTPLATMP